MIITINRSNVSCLAKNNPWNFFVWTTKDWHLEQISTDMEFCNKMIAQSRKFFKLCILPEILGKFYTRRPILNNIANQANYLQQIEPVIKDQGDNEKTHCYCKKENVGTTMIVCDKVECQIKWFHVRFIAIVQTVNMWKSFWNTSLGYFYSIHFICIYDKNMKMVKWY